MAASPVAYSSARRLCLLVLATILAALAATTTVWAAQGALEVVDVRAEGFPRVAVRLNATSRDGQPLGEIRAEQLRMLEDGQAPASVELFRVREPSAPIAIVLVVDAGRTMVEQGSLPSVREAMKTYLEQMRPLDQVGLVSFGGGVTLGQPLTSDRARVGREIDRIQTSRGTRLYDGLLRGAAEAASAPGGTRAVVLISGGPDAGSTADLAQAVALARQATVPVYTVAYGSAAPTDVLKRLAEETGGRFQHALGGRELVQAVSQVGRQVSSQYELTWTSRTPATPGRWVTARLALDMPRATEAITSFGYRIPGGPAAGDAQAVPSAAARPSEVGVLAAGLLAGLGVAVLYAGLVLGTVRHRLRGRLLRYVGGLEAGEEPPELIRASLAPLTARAARLGARLVPRSRLERFRENLTQAGFYADRHLQYLLAAKIALAGLLGVVSYGAANLSIGGPRALLIGVTLGVLGFYLPNVWLGRRIKARQRAITRQLADALDLLSIGVGAGLSFDGSVLELVQRSDNELADEFALVLREMNVGTGRREALQHLAQRTQVDDIRLLVASLIQADELGTSLGNTLNVQADQLRLRRRQRAQELAQQAAIKMLIPMVFLIFPTILVVILGPALPQLLRSFGG